MGGRAAIWAMGLGSALFAAMAVLVGLGATGGFDLPIMAAAPGLHGSVGDVIAVAVSRGLGFAGLTGATVVLVAGLLWRGRRGDAAMVGAAMFVGLVLMWAIKAAYARARPEVFPWVDPAEGWSFPSGHAFLNAAFWLLLAVVVKRPWAWALGIAMMLIAGAFRVVAGVHWPSDVIAGWSLGVVLVAAAVVVRGRFTRAPASAINAGL